MDGHGVHKLLTFYCRRIWMTNERKVSLNTRYQDMNTFRAHFNSSFNRSYLLPGSLHTKNFQSYRKAVTSLLPADPNSAPRGKFLFSLPLSCSQTSSDGGTMSCLEANFSQRTSTLWSSDGWTVCRRMQVHLCKHCGRMLSVIPSLRPQWRSWRGS